MEDDNTDRLRALQLDCGMTPMKLITWQAAIVLLYTNKIDVLEEYEAKVSSSRITICVPSVVRLRKPVVRDKRIKWSRTGVYARDKYRCCYCGKKFPESQLEFDHVIPRSRWKGPRHKVTDWENIVTACQKCNRKKDNRTPAEAGMKMHFQPHVPTSLPTQPVVIDLDRAPAEWLPYLGQRQAESA